MTRYDHGGTIWAILPNALSTLRARADMGQMEPPSAAMRPAPSMPTGGAIAVLPLAGEIMQRDNPFAAFSNGTSVEAFRAAFDQAMSNPAVAGVVINVDSPGGTVYGVPELTDAIYAARGRKPIVAVANALAASAAYWIASAADTLLVTPSGEVGSVGVFVEHYDISGALAQAGIASTVISAGKYKTEGLSSGPLSQEARDYLQSRVNEYHLSFMKALARNRGVPLATVRAGFGEGRTVSAAQAVSLGMADGVATLDQAIQSMARNLAAGGRTQTANRRASAAAYGDEDDMPFADADTLTPSAAAEATDTQLDTEAPPIEAPRGYALELAERRLRFSRMRLA